MCDGLLMILANALLSVADILGQQTCWLYAGAFHFPLGGEGWSVAISLESAGRLRVDACRYGQVRDTLWTLAGDRERLAELVSELSDRTALTVG